MKAIVISEEAFEDAFKVAADELALTKFKAQAIGEFGVKDLDVPEDVRQILAQRLSDMHRAFHFHLFQSLKDRLRNA